MCITRCGNLFGYGDLNWSRIIPGTLRSLYRGERPVIRSDGSPVRDYIHMVDAVEGYLALAERMDDASLHGRAFNFGTGEPVSVLDLTHKLIRAMDREDLEPDVRNEAQGEISHQYLSWDLSRKLLGWTPGATLDARLAETAAWYRAYLTKHDVEENRGA